MNIIITGPGNSGKTFIARAIAQIVPTEGVTLTQIITATKSVLMNPEKDCLLIVDDCPRLEDILSVEEIHREKNAQQKIIYCTNVPIEDFTAPIVKEMIVIDLYRNRQPLF